MAALQPRKPYTEEELRKLYPAGLDLLQVQVLMRHGERTPTRGRFQNTGLPPFWPYCHVPKLLKSPVLDRESSNRTSTMEWIQRLETFEESHDAPQAATGPRGELDGVCAMGVLTDEGRASTHELGRRLRSLYVDRLGFLPPAIRSTDGMYLRSTHMPRALESMQQTFLALYPPQTRLPGADGSPFEPPPIVIREMKDETLYPNEAFCPRWKELAAAFKERAAARWNDSEELEYLNRLWAKWMPEDSPRVAVDSHPELYGIMDTVNATLAHGPDTRLPNEFYDEKGMRTTEKIVLEAAIAGFRESLEFRTLGTGALAGDIVQRMVASAEAAAAPPPAERSSSASAKSTNIITTASANPVKFGLSGCHDSTLAGFLVSMGAADDRDMPWPPFTSHIAIELFKKTQPDLSFSSPPPTTTTPVTTTTSSGSTGGSGSTWSTLMSRLSSSSSSSSSKQPSTLPPSSSIGRKPTHSLTPAEKAKLDGYFVRVRYNDEAVKVPGCRAPGNHLDGDESFCTLAAFKAVADKFTPRDWRAECQANLGDAAFPKRPDPPAGY